MLKIVNLLNKLRFKVAKLQNKQEWCVLEFGTVKEQQFRQKSFEKKNLSFFSVKFLP